MFPFFRMLKGGGCPDGVPSTVLDAYLTAFVDRIRERQEVCTAQRRRRLPAFVEDVVGRGAETAVRRAQKTRRRP